MKKLAQLALFSVWFVSSFAMGFDKSKGKKTLKVDTQNSKLVWKGKKFTGEHWGNINISNGSLIVDGTKLKGGAFDIDLKSITVTDITDKDGNAKLVGHLKGEDFFAADKFPKSTFVITSATPKDKENYEIAGKLTIRGVSREIKFPAVVTIDSKKATAKAKITINRTDFGIKYGSKSFFENLGDKFIYDDFELDVTLTSAL